jgi:hypothetical protein
MMPYDKNYSTNKGKSAKLEIERKRRGGQNL